MSYIQKTIGALELLVALVCFAGVLRVTWLLNQDNFHDEWGGLTIIILAPLSVVLAAAGYSLFRYGKYKPQILILLALTGMAAWFYYADRGYQFFEKRQHVASQKLIN